MNFFFEYNKNGTNEDELSCIPIPTFIFKGSVRDGNEESLAIGEGNMIPSSDVHL